MLGFRWIGVGLCLIGLVPSASTPLTQLKSKCGSSGLGLKLLPVKLRTGLSLMDFAVLTLLPLAKPCGRLSPDDQALYRLGLSGGLFTESYKAKWTDQDDQCQWCGSRDSLQHRYWECPQHQDLRDLHAPQAQHLHEWIPPALALRGCALQSPTHEAWLTTLLSIPTEAPPPFRPLDPGMLSHVFTDGSCLWQSDVRFRLASWAVLLACPVSPVWNSGSSVVLCAAALSGLCQTAFRAELFAVAYTLHWAARQGAPVCVWTDCLGVVNRYNLTFWGSRKINLHGANADLWVWIAQSVAILGRDYIQIRKVPAHRTLQSARNSRELWMFYNNSLVDRAARLANQARPQVFWQQWESHVAAATAADGIFHQVSALQLAVAQRQVRHGTTT